MGIRNLTRLLATVIILSDVTNASLRITFVSYESLATCLSECLNGLCVKGNLGNEISEWHCNCKMGYYGKDCSKHPCQENPCINDGKCVPTEVDGRYSSSVFMRMDPLTSLVYKVIASKYQQDTVLGYRCDCPAGYPGEHCEEKSFCAGTPEAENSVDGEVVTCSGVGTCTQFRDTATCHCLDGHSGPRCREYTACKKNPCDNDFPCLPLYGSARALIRNYACGCQGPSERCTEYDTYTCRNGTDCNKSVVGSIQIKIQPNPEPCQQGYRRRGDACVDVDECADASATECHVQATCVNVDGGYKCKCKAGYRGNGLYCALTQQCQEDAQCGPNASCVIENGIRTCRCNPGYQGNGKTCTNLYKCKDSNNCASNEYCMVEDNGSSCKCNQGFSRSSSNSCQDVNECKDLNICGAHSVCQNTLGSYTCRCRHGFALSNGACVDVNECTQTSFPCHEEASCENTRGSFRCRCKAGFEGDGYTCRDVNECSRGHHQCSRNAICRNTKGSYNCHCNHGFHGDGRTCDDINECLDKRACSSGAKCMNTVGSYRCRENKIDMAFAIYFKSRTRSRDIPRMTGLSNPASDGMSACVWYKLSRQPTNRRSLFQYLVEQRVQGFQVWITTHPSPHLEVQVIDEQTVTIPFPVHKLGWTHLCITWNKGLVEVWRNGHRHNPTEVYRTKYYHRFPASTVSAMVLGQHSEDMQLDLGITTPTTAFQGWITQLMFYSHTLTKAEVHAAARKTPSLQGAISTWDQWKHLVSGPSVVARRFRKTTSG